MASLLSEVSPHLITNHVIKSAEQVFYGNKTVFTTPQTSTSQSNTVAEHSTQQRKLKNDIQLAKKVIDDALAGKVSQNSSAGNAEIANLNNEIASLKLDNEHLHKEVDELRHLFEKVLNSTGKASEAPASIKTKAQPEKTLAKDDNDDFDLFGSDEEVEESDEQKRVREERLAAYAAKKSKKPGPIAKSSVILDVKPWDDETDLKKMEECVRSVKLDGLNWGAGKLIPVGYGIQKLQIVSTIEDDKVSVDTDLIEFIQDEFADYVQSVDIVAFNKI